MYRTHVITLFIVLYYCITALFKLTRHVRKNQACLMGYREFDGLLRSSLPEEIVFSTDFDYFKSLLVTNTFYQLMSRLYTIITAKKH